MHQQHVPKTYPDHQYISKSHIRNSKNVRTISNRKIAHGAKKKWNVELIPSQNKSASYKTCHTAELMDTAAKSA